PVTISATAPLVVRIYAYNAESANGTWGPGESSDGNDLSLAGSFRILPVRFANIAASLKGKEIEVRWTNATESDVSYYVIERSGNGQTFTELSKATPLKNDGGKADYGSLDLQPNKVNYYRIKAIETTGRAFYSSVVKIEINLSQASMGLYPNPVKQGAQLMLQVSSATAGKYDVRIYNAGGQLVHREAITVNGASSTQSISLRQFQKGMYVAEVAGAQRMLQQFIIQ
ncbi:MAG TPA: T9SS type A sorting domain-containing protein, partial [Flavisolibacter sp.]|nr:T9SS type A sorting domain-containing protein [Flavisolibacter sp.]